MNFREYLSESEVNNMSDVIKILGKSIPSDSKMKSFLKKYFDIDKSNAMIGTGDEETDEFLADIMMQYKTDMSDVYGL